MSGTNRLVACLLYGSGLRLREGLRLRVKDLAFGRNECTVRDGKGRKDRRTMLPTRLHAPLQRHLRQVKVIHEDDTAEGFGTVHLPDALARKYPNAAHEWRWQFVFPSARRSRDPRSNAVHRHHRSDSAVQRAVKQAADAIDLAKRATCHTLRHSFTSLRSVNLPQVGLPRTGSRTATMSALCKSCWATRTSAPR
jgi:integrase